MSATPNNLAKQLTTKHRKSIALQAISCKDKITAIANDHQVSRKFVYQQRNKASTAVNDAFDNSSNSKSDILFYLPITRDWLNSFIVSLTLNCKSSYRGIQNVFDDNFDTPVSLGYIHELVTKDSTKANTINQSEDLKNVTLGANDELFYNNQPILSGIDIPSLYCYLLSQEKNRNQETWSVNLLHLQNQGYKPERVIADDADGLRNGHEQILWDIPCDYDNFHITRDMMDIRRYFRNRMKSLKTELIDFTSKSAFSVKAETREKYKALLPAVIDEEKLISSLSPTIDTLISWMEHDVLNMPGVPMKERKEMFHFILSEFDKLAEIHPHRLQALCSKLRNNRDEILAFVNVLDSKFYKIADRYKCSIEFIWKVCELHRCGHHSENYHQRLQPLLTIIGEEKFEEIEVEVIAALDSTERTSSMVENLNGRVKSYLHNRKECSQTFLNFLRFYLNHKPFRRSRRKTRLHKSPAEILTGNKHPHWLEMLGYSKFKRVA